MPRFVALHNCGYVIISAASAPMCPMQLSIGPLVVRRFRRSLHPLIPVLLFRVQVKVQTVPGFAKGMLDGFPKYIQMEGVGG